MMPMQAHAVCLKPNHSACFSELLSPNSLHYSELPQHHLAAAPGAYHQQQHPSVTAAGAYHHQYQHHHQYHHHQQPPHQIAPAAIYYQPQSLHSTLLVQHPATGYGHQYQPLQQQYNGPTYYSNQVNQTHQATSQQQVMSERRLRPRHRGATALGGRQRDDDDDDDYEVDKDDEEPGSSDSADESSSSRRQSGSPPTGAAVAAARANSNASIKTAQRWTQEEHDLLLSVVEQFGNSRRWSEIAKHIPGRTGKQCRERFVNHMNPNSKKGSWDVAEELLLCKWHSILGSHWARITRKLDGRTENAVKNHWNAAMRAKLPMRRNTPLNMYVSHLRNGVEPSDALVKVLEALQEQHPDLVAETARAAADIVQRRLNPASAAALAAGAAGGQGGMQQQQQELGMRAPAGLHGAGGYHHAAASAAAAAAASPGVAAGRGPPDFTGFSHDAGNAAALSPRPLQQQQLSTTQLGLQHPQQQQAAGYINTQHVLLAAGQQTQEPGGLEEEQSPMQRRQQPCAAYPLATSAQPVAEQSSLATASAAGAGPAASVVKYERTAPAAAAGEAAAEPGQPAAKRARLSSGTSAVSCGSARASPFPTAAAMAAAQIPTSQQQQPPPSLPPQEAAPADFHSPNNTSSNSNTSCMHGAAAVASNLQQQLPVLQQHALLSGPLQTLPAAELHPQHTHSGRLSAELAAATATARAQAKSRCTQQVVAETLTEVAVRCHHLAEELNIEEHVRSMQREREMQRRQQQLQRQRSTPGMQQQQQHHPHHPGLLYQHNSEPPMPAAAAAPGGVFAPAPSSQYVDHWQHLEQQTTLELLRLQQGQQGQQQGVVRRAPTNLSDEAFDALLARASEGWSGAAASTSTAPQPLIGPAATHPPAVPPANGAAFLVTHPQQQQSQQLGVRLSDAGSVPSQAATPITTALGLDGHSHQSAMQQQAPRGREITTSIYPTHHLQPHAGLYRSHSDVVQPAAAAATQDMLLPDWPPLQTSLPVQQQRPSSSGIMQHKHQQYTMHAQQLASAPVLHHTLDRVSDQGSQHHLARTLSAPAYRPGALPLLQMAPLDMTPSAAADDDDIAGPTVPPAARQADVSIRLPAYPEGGVGGPLSAAVGGAAAPPVSSSSTGLPAHSQGPCVLLGSSDIRELQEQGTQFLGMLHGDLAELFDDYQE